ncbi:uncharacterized protein BYT42DRAFT_490379 [Radiomyces spectabilis]|uniref:uncharacterized protein n=1 Tax=Radiomyces spectabilis TaxID=64574 RepID=UPI00222038DB|nr:uncharacterized protein BYT42DRAFT_490379 [Radiomyces spectabilis]KAI8391186.1 hypothetical protein BYT42DRAFT_490379 [Radiomyces spectabilis]
MPTINFAGIAPASVANSLSPISFSGNSLNVKFNLIVNIQNPNVLPIKLSSVNATAFYPTAAGRTPIGGGFLPYQYVPKQSDFNFTYPFAIKYNPSQDSDQTILDSIADKCGLTGGGKQDLNIDYDIHLTAKVLFVTVHPTISSSASFPCPLDVSFAPQLRS